ncbi:MAG: helix-turn-helix domain-containing protein [Pseudomonadota bacterium]
MCQKDFLNQLDLSRRWGIAPRTLEQWRWKGEGPPFLKIGHRVRYRLSDIETYEQNHLLKSTTQISQIRKKGGLHD